MQKKNFLSKVLLFGEYSLIRGSKGLAIPYKSFSGQLKISEHEIDSKLNVSLKNFCEYLENSSILSRSIDTKSFSCDLEKGLYFDSNIPQGYGVGSSGALCASILCEYGKDIKQKESYTSDELRYMQDIMALMEGFYHGTSSGVDPLISFVEKPILIESRNKVKVIDLPPVSDMADFFLIDTGFSRRTSPLVHEFMQMCSCDTFQEKVDSLITWTNNAIDAFLIGDAENLQKNIFEISKFQYLHMEKMIPKDFKELWLNGLESKKYFMKLCGAGGGGFLTTYLCEKDETFMQGREYFRL